VTGRIARALPGRIGRTFSRDYVSLILTGVAAVLILAGILTAVRASGWTSTLSDLAVNVAASALVAAAAFLAFVGRSRLSAARRIRAAQRAAVRAVGGREPDRLKQAEAVAAQITSRADPGHVLIEAPAGSGRSTFLQTVRAVLVNRGVITVAITEWDLVDVTVTQAAAAEFQRLLAEGGIGGPLQRTMEFLASRRQAVVLIDGLDASPHAARRTSAVEVVRQRVEELSVAHLPFVAIINPGSTPDESAGSRIQLPPVVPPALPRLLGIRVDSADQSRVIADARRLAAELPHLSVSLHTIREAGRALRNMGSQDRTLLADLRYNLVAHGPVVYLLGVLRSVGFPAASTPEAAAASLRRLVELMLLNDSFDVPWSLATAHGDWNAVDSMLRGVIELEGHAIVRRVDRRGDVYVRFLDPELRELAVGAVLARSGVVFAYSRMRSRTAFAGELIHRMLAAADRREAAGIMATASRTAADAGFLSAMEDARTAIHVLAPAIAPVDPLPLPEFWSQADDGDRALFVRRLQDIPPSYTLFLWSRLERPYFAETAHALRRTIARALGRHGAVTWPRLAERWTALVGAAESGGLAWRNRRDRSWQTSGNSVASLCWILPTLTLTAPGDDAPTVHDLLERLTDSVVPGGDLTDDGRADPGIEISLAEGCKDAAYFASTEGLPGTDSVWSVTEKIATEGKSWVSRFLALQAAGLMVTAQPGQRRKYLRLARRLTAERHQLIRRYSQYLSSEILLRTLSGADVFEAIWSDDTDALAYAGDGLSDEAARSLAEITILLNLVEARLRMPEDGNEGARLRVQALTADTLPDCMTSPVLALGAETLLCRCPLALCNPALQNRNLRQISSPFAHRCLYNSPALPRGEHGALDVHLRRLRRA
jgi:hypothetical protein